MNRELMVKTVAEMIWDGGGLQDVARGVVDAILPQVTTVEDVEALPVGSWVLAGKGQLFKVAPDRRAPDFRFRSEVGDYWTADALLSEFGPLTVVWRPEP